MPSFLFVAGAFHGAWAWTEVCRELATRGYEAHRIDLTGQGSRAHAAGPMTDLSTHISDVVAYVEAEGMREVTLVGHSYSGMVITGAADRLEGNIERLVYLDAVVPEDGQSAADIAGPLIIGKAVELAARGDGWSVPCFFPIEKFGIFDSEQEAWLISKLTPHPLRTMFEPVRLRKTFSGPRTFIYCGADPIGLFDNYARTAKDSPDWNYINLDTRHDPMITHPLMVVEAILAASAKDISGEGLTNKVLREVVDDDQRSSQ